MPKSLPTPAASGDVWGSALNNFLTQLQSTTDGAINYATTRPVKTIEDAGYTMIDTTLKEIIMWNGTTWVVLLGGLSQGRPIIAADLELYVRTDGNDANYGLFNTAAGAFATIQKAVDTASRIDGNGFKININVAGGIYNGFGVKKSFGHNNEIIIKGDSTNNTAVTLNSTFNVSNDSYSAVYISNSQDSITVQDLTLNLTSPDVSSGCIQVNHGSIATCKNVNFTSTLTVNNISGTHVAIAGTNGILSITGNTTISGSYNHCFWAFVNGLMSLTGTITMNSPAFGTCAAADLAGIIDAFSLESFIGTATGTRYVSGPSSVIRTKLGSGGVDFFPGSAPGGLSGNGFYY